MEEVGFQATLKATDTCATFLNMAQKEIEVILTRQLASYLVMPIFIVDPAGTLVFYNEPAEMILGRRFEETGEMPAAEWATIFTPMDDAGLPLSPEALPLMITVAERRPAHRSIWIRGLDNVLRHIEVIAFPLIGQAGRNVGAVAILWELQE
jgi:PAS domain-containing protein